MYPVEYAIEGEPETSIARCPEFRSVIGDKPEFWYIRKRLHPWDDIERYRAGFQYRYWTLERGWWHCCPTQFETAEAALAAYRSGVRNES